MTVSEYHPSLIYVDKAGAYASGALALKYLTRMEMTVSDEQPSLLHYIINFDRKSFIVEIPAIKCDILFFVLDALQYKLECFPWQDFSS